MKPNTNVYVIDGDSVVIITKQNEKILIDLDDLERVNKHCWSVDSKGYVNAGGKCLGGTTRLHRFILDCPKGYVVDHINRDKLDNRKSNLRIVTNQQNQFNRKLGKNNVSGCIGVHYNKKCKKWCCQLTHNGKCVYSALFDNINDAIEQRKSLEKQYFKI